MEECFDGLLEEIFWEVTRHSHDSGKVIGRLKNSRDVDDILKFKYHLGKYFAYKYVRSMIQVIAGKMKRFEEIDEYMLESEINFVNYCNSLGNTKIHVVELMFTHIIEQYKEKYANINSHRFPEYASIIKGKYDAYFDCHKVFLKMNFYSKSITIQH